MRGQIRKNVAHAREKWPISVAGDGKKGGMRARGAGKGGNQGGSKGREDEE